MEIVIASYDDWEALYVDGVSVCQDHKITIQDLKEFVPNGQFKDLVNKEVDYGWFEESGADSLPDKLEDVVFKE